MKDGVKKLNSGWTLAEFVIACTIVIILASITLTYFEGARQKARDAQRRTDLKRLALALDLYYNANQSFPSTSGAWWANCSSSAGGPHGTSGATGWIPNLAPTYIGVLPLDPKTLNPNGCYWYRSDGINYKIEAYGTIESICPVPTTDTMYNSVDQGGPTGCTFSQYTAGAASWN